MFFSPWPIFRPQWWASSGSTVTLLSNAVFEHLGFLNFAFIHAVMQTAVILLLSHMTACSVSVSIGKEKAWCVQQLGETNVPFPK